MDLSFPPSPPSFPPTPFRQPHQPPPSAPPALSVIPAKAGIQSNHPRVSGTTAGQVRVFVCPVCNHPMKWWRRGRLVFLLDSRFRGNDGGGGGNDEKGALKRRGVGALMYIIPYMNILQTNPWIYPSRPPLRHSRQPLSVSPASPLRQPRQPSPSAPPAPSVIPAKAGIQSKNRRQRRHYSNLRFVREPNTSQACNPLRILIHNSLLYNARV